MYFLFPNTEIIVKLKLNIQSFSKNEFQKHFSRVFVFAIDKIKIRRVLISAKRAELA